MRTGLRLIGAALALACWNPCSVAADAQPPAAPLLRVEPGSSPGLPRKLAVDERRGVLYSVGDDKAVRSWRLADLRALDVWRVPASTGVEGQLFAVAVSPDGNTLATAGWTGWEWDREMSVYLFDTRSGEIVRRLTGFKDAVGALGFSPDGAFLAVGLLGNSGLHLYSTRDFRRTFSDLQYGDKILGLDFAADGRLATVSLDGYLRIYAPAHRLVARLPLAEGKKLTQVAFSPSGEELAVGFNDARHIAVYSTRTGTLVRLHDAPGVSDVVNLSVLTWSPDGRYLYGGGDPEAHAMARLFRWDLRAGGAPKPVTVAAQRLSAVAALRDGAVSFVAEDPVLGILRPDGAIRTAPPPGIADFRQADAAFRVSDDAREIQIPLGQSGKPVVGFSLRALDLGPARSPDLRTKPPAPDVDPAVQWQPGKAAASVNGRKVALDDYEFVRSVASLSSGRYLLGTEWAVRLVDAEARLLWRSNVAGIVWNVRPSGDRRFVVATLSDGTVRWLRASDGRELLSLFVQAGTMEWVAWTPDGYYASSPHGDDLIGWVVNQGKDRAADFYHASQFERLLYRPDIVRAALDDTPLPGTRALQPSRRFDIKDLASIAPPRIRLLAIDPVDPQQDLFRLRFSAERQSQPMREYVIFVDDVPVVRAAERVIEGKERDALVREVTIPRIGRHGTVRIEVSSGTAIGVREAPLPGVGKPNARPPPGDLYVLAVGVKEFPRLPKELALDYTDRDATEVVRFFERDGRRLFRAVHAKVLADAAGDAPVKSAVLGHLDFLKRAGPNDTVILFLASHGFSDAAGNYYFAPADSRHEDLCTLLPQTAPTWGGLCGPLRGKMGDLSSFVPWQALFDGLGASAGRRILIVDTCEARRITGAVEVGSLRKRSASSRFSLFLASRDGEASQEHPPARHGLFTHALLQGLRGDSDRDGDGAVTLRELFEYVVPTVERLRDKRLGPMTPQLLAPGVLADTPLARVR